MFPKGTSNQPDHLTSAPPVRRPPQVLGVGKVAVKLRGGAVRSGQAQAAGAPNTMPDLGRCIWKNLIAC